MNEITWGIPVVIYLFLAGLGSGSFCLGIMASRRKGSGWRECTRTAFLLAPVAIAAGLFMLILDLRYKSRFWMTLTVLNVASPMSVGVWLLTVFMAVSVLTAICWLPLGSRQRIVWIGKLTLWDRTQFRNALELIGILAALGVSVYTGVLLSATVLPLWRNLGLPLLFFLSALSLGIEGGAILALIALRKNNPEAMKEPLRFLKRAYRVMIPLYFFSAAAFVFFLTADPGSRTDAFHLMTGWSGLIWWIGVVGIGIIVPLVLVIKRDTEPIRHAWFFSGCLLAGDFLLRLVLILAGQGAI